MCLVELRLLTWCFLLRSLSLISYFLLFFSVSAGSSFSRLSGSSATLPGPAAASLADATGGGGGGREEEEGAGLMWEKKAEEEEGAGG